MKKRHAENFCMSFLCTDGPKGKTFRPEVFGKSPSKSGHQHDCVSCPASAFLKRNQINKP